MENTNKKPIFTEAVNLENTKGEYNLFTKSVLKLWIIAMSILRTVKTATQKLSVMQYESLVSCLWIVNHMANKLEGICSISSSVHDNCFCKARQAIKDCICKFCQYEMQNLFLSNRYS